MSKINNTIDQPLKEIEDNVDQLKKDLEYIDLQLTEIENGNQSKEASGSWVEEPFTFISSNISSKLCNYFEPIFAKIAKDPTIIANDSTSDIEHFKLCDANDDSSSSYANRYSIRSDLEDLKFRYANDDSFNRYSIRSDIEDLKFRYANDDSFSTYANRYSNYNDDFCFI